MILERHTKSAIILFTLVTLFLGCDTDQDTFVTGALLYRNTGDLKQFTIISDSISVSPENRYNHKIGGKSLSLAGTYKNISAFSVFKFLKPQQSTIDSLLSAKITFSVNSVWADGLREFALYNTVTDWADSADIDPGLFSNLGSPISVYNASSEADSLISEISFEIDIDDIESWDSYGAVLIKNSDAGNAMVSLSTDNSSSSPKLELIRSISGVADTSKVSSREGTYYIETGLNTEKNIIADGAASGFVLDIGLADFNPAPTSIHKCILNLTVTESLITGSSMLVLIQLLSNEFTTIEDATIDTGKSIDLEILPGVSTYSVDISNFITTWHNYATVDHGILFKSFYLNNSPNYVVIEPADSLVIEYTTLPEVE